MKLDDIPAYQAYKRLKRLPKNTSEFEYAQNGDPVIQIGETYCRARSSITGRICGNAISDNNNLRRHAEKIHGFPKHSPLKRSKTHRQHREAEVFYEDLMKYETYDKGRSPRAVQLDHGGADHDEPNGVDEKSVSVKQEQHTPTLSATLLDERDNKDDIAANSRHSSSFSEKSTMRDSRTDDTEPLLGNGGGDSIFQGEIKHEDEEDLQLELAKAEAEERLQRAILRKLEMKKKLASLRERRAES